MNESRRIAELEAKLHRMEALYAHQSQMISGVISSLQATYMLLTKKGSIDIEADAPFFHKVYVSTLAKMDQVQANLRDSA
jgi:hypothetical protein